MFVGYKQLAISISYKQLAISYKQLAISIGNYYWQLVIGASAVVLDSGAGLDSVQTP